MQRAYVWDSLLIFTDIKDIDFVVQRLLWTRLLLLLFKIVIYCIGCECEKRLWTNHEWMFDAIYTVSPWTTASYFVLSLAEYNMSTAEGFHRLGDVVRQSSLKRCCPWSPSLSAPVMQHDQQQRDWRTHNNNYSSTTICRSIESKCVMRVPCLLIVAERFSIRGLSGAELCMLHRHQTAADLARPPTLYADHQRMIVEVVLAFVIIFTEVLDRINLWSNAWMTAMNVLPVKVRVTYMWHTRLCITE